MFATFQKITIHLLVAFCLFSVFALSVSNAQSPTCTPGSTDPNCYSGPIPGSDPDDEDDGSSPGGGNDDDGSSPGGNKSNSLENPLKFDTIEGFLLGVIDVILVFATPLIVLFIMYAGFKFVTAGGDAAKVTEARKQLTWAVVGGLLVLGARVLLEVIEGTITAFQANP